MATPSAASFETPITVKVNFNGVTRRFKVPLRDLTAHHLDNTLRSWLPIQPEANTVIERYSDSAAAYVLLTRENVAAYKQLYRAARAKQKLKLRVISKPLPKPEPQPEPKPEPEPESKPEPESESEHSIAMAPKPVTVEDEITPEAAVQDQNAPAPIETAPIETGHTTERSSSPRAEHCPAALPSCAPDSIIPPAVVSGDYADFLSHWRARGMPKMTPRRDDEGVVFIGAPSVQSQGASLPQASSPKKVETELLDVLEKIKPLGEEIQHLMSKDKMSEKPTEPIATQSELLSACPGRPFTIKCNSCDRGLPDSHFHCSACDHGDFDLCQSCVDQGITCHDDDHWLIKRTIENDEIKYSTTQYHPKKLSQAKIASAATTQSASFTLPMRSRSDIHPVPVAPSVAMGTGRTCNSCVYPLPEKDFLHCNTCEDFDLCKKCFLNDQHGHHPQHEFTAAVPGEILSDEILARLPAGRGVEHNAICDGCEQSIRGVRHKCLTCPDWDYCPECVQNAAFVHAGHRFVAIYEPLGYAHVTGTGRKATHHGICCDGPLCQLLGKKHITGDRYKCAVCHDTDFCANCEASPSNLHNKTHPLIKFKTPVRHVSVSTTGEHEDGRRLPAMGDQPAPCRQSRGPVPAPRESIAASPVQTVIDVQPTEQQPPKISDQVKPSEKLDSPSQETLVDAKRETATPDLIGIFQRDTVADGTVMPPNHTFQQTWVLRNEGKASWPAGCSVKFVGGDYMGAVDPEHPAGIGELVSASESTVCYSALSPGQEFPFTVLMRTPEREGKVISYWRLTTADGAKFGHKLWCDVIVKASEQPAPAASQMIIPTLEHESPSSSLHEAAQTSKSETETESETATSQEKASEDEYEVCGEEDSWVGDSGDEGFMTDEEYDILDASDEEQFDQQQAAAKK